MPLNYIIEEVTDREVPLTDSILELIHPDKDRARSVFVKQLRIALKEFCRHYPLVMSKRVDSSPYTFVDNSEGYKLGNITKENVELIPQGIAGIQTSELSKSITRNNYYYDEPTHTLKYGSGLVTYFTYYPIYANNSVNEDFTEDSGIYFIAPNTSEGDMLIDQISYTLLTFLQNTRNTVSPQFQMQFFNFDQRLRDLQIQLDKNYAYSSTIYNIWSKNGI